MPGGQDGAGAPAADPAGAAVGQAEVGGGRPRVADRVGGDERRVEGAPDAAPGDEALEPAGRAELVVGQEQADVELGPGLDLDPADPLAVQEDGRQSEPAPVLGHHLGRGAHVGVEAGAQVGQLGPEGGRRDESGVAPGRRARRASSRAVSLAAASVRTSSRAPPPRIDHMRRLSSPSTTARTTSTTRATSQGDHQLVVEVGGVGVAQGPGRQAAAQVAEQPRGDGHPQEEGHGEGDEEPPGVAAEPAVERAGDDEPGEGRRVAQLVDALQPRRVLGRVLDHGPPVPAVRVAPSPGLASAVGSPLGGVP